MTQDLNMCQHTYEIFTPGGHEHRLVWAGLGGITFIKSFGNLQLGIPQEERQCWEGAKLHSQFIKNWGGE
jgi:hypothetical protein